MKALIALIILAILSATAHASYDRPVDTAGTLCMLDKHCEKQSEE